MREIWSQPSAMILLIWLASLDIPPASPDAEGIPVGIPPIIPPSSIIIGTLRSPVRLSQPPVDSLWLAALPLTGIFWDRHCCVISSGNWRLCWMKRGASTNVAVSPFTTCHSTSHTILSLCEIIPTWQWNWMHVSAMNMKVNYQPNSRIVRAESQYNKSIPMDHHSIAANWVFRKREIHRHRLTIRTRVHHAAVENLKRVTMKMNYIN